MRRRLLAPQPVHAPDLARSLPPGAGFVIAGAGSVLFWALVAGIAVIV